MMSGSNQGCTQEQCGVDITFFVPCFNEAENIGATITAIVEGTEGLALNYEILVFDDCSTDGITHVIRKIIQDNPKLPVKLICNEKRRGLGFNYFRGAFIGKGRHYMLVNGDNVEPSDTIRKIVEHCGKWDIVIPYFGSNDRRSFFRRRVSGIFTKLVNMISGHKIKYYNGPILHLTENVRFWRSETVGYGYQAELLCRILNENVSYTQIEVSNADRERGFSKAFSFGNILSVLNSLFHILLRRLEYASLRILKR